MANRLQVDLEVDPNDRGQTRVKTISSQLDDFERGMKKGERAGVDLLAVFKGNVLADYFTRGLNAAIAFGAESIRAAATASDANRVLEFSATQAGLAYERAAELAEDFGKRVGASNTEAARTFSDLIRLAERAGRAGDIELIGKRFADLAAARGLRGAELQTLIGTILSGQDEGLNRLGIDDPGKLNQAFAAQLGKTAEALTQTEKAQAALNAVLEKGAAATGQAEERLRGTSGQLDSAAAAAENLKTQFGEAITNSVEFKTALELVSSALSSIVTSHEEARRELAKGLKSPEQLAQEAREGTGRQALNVFKGAASLIFGAGFTAADYAMFLSGQISADELRTNIAGSTAAAFNPGQLQYEADVARFRALQGDIQEQQKKASQVGKTDAAANFWARLAADAKAAEEASKKAAEEMKKLSELARTGRDDVRKFLGAEVAASDRENPLLALFIRAQTEIDETRERFRVFGAEFAEEMVRIKRETLDAEIAVARFQSGLTALRLGQEAERLSLPGGGLTGPEERRLGVLNARISQLAGAGDIERQLRFFQNPNARFSELDARRQFDEQLRGLQALDVSGAGFAGQKALADAILKLTGTIEPEFLARSTDPVARAGRFATIDALHVQREAAAREVEEALDRERAGALIQEQARAQLSLVAGAQGLSRADQLKEFLAITGALSEKELTPDLRRARVDFLLEAQQLESGKERAAEARAQAIDGVMKKLDAMITAKGLKIDTPPTDLRIQLSDNLTPEMLGTTPVATSGT